MFRLQTFRHLIRLILDIYIYQEGGRGGGGGGGVSICNLRVLFEKLYSHINYLKCILHFTKHHYLNVIMNELHMAMFHFNFACHESPPPKLL